jgi:sulfhydrogenase subunit delta
MAKPDWNMKPKVGVYKFSSCDGCQLAFLNAGVRLIELSNQVEFSHFVEAGIDNEQAKVDIAFIEGSISTPRELERIKEIRANAKFLITIGACATSGGLQALRNGKDLDEWMSTVYAKPEYIESLTTSTAISHHVKVDHEIWGCPVSSAQVLSAISMLLKGAKPIDEHDSVCMKCKRDGNVCVLITKKIPCMGPVTKTGCGALCPSAGRGCYACYGPSENPNSKALANQFKGFGLVDEHISRLFKLIYSQEQEFKHD